MHIHDKVQAALATEPDGNDDDVGIGSNLPEKWIILTTSVNSKSTPMNEHNEFFSAGALGNVDPDWHRIYAVVEYLN